MRKNPTSAIVLFMVAAAGVVLFSPPESRAQIGGPRVLEGRMTGGGSVFTDADDLWAPAGTRVTHAFQLNCDSFRQPNNMQIEVHLPNGGGGRFSLDELTFAWCWDDPQINSKSPAAKFNTFFGSGKGLYNGDPGYCADWHLSDAGEPGTEDRVRSMRLWKALNGDCAQQEGLFIFSIYLEPGHPLTSGNHQALKAGK